MRWSPSRAPRSGSGTDCAQVCEDAWRERPSHGFVVNLVCMCLGIGPLLRDTIRARGGVKSDKTPRGFTHRSGKPSQGGRQARRAPQSRAGKLRTYTGRHGSCRLRGGCMIRGRAGHRPVAPHQCRQTLHAQDDKCPPAAPRAPAHRSLARPPLAPRPRARAGCATATQAALPSRHMILLAFASLLCSR